MRIGVADTGLVYIGMSARKRASPLFYVIGAGLASPGLRGYDSEPGKYAGKARRGRTSSG